MFCAWIDARALGVSLGVWVFEKSATPVCPMVLIVVFKVSSFSPVAQKMWCVEMVQQHCLWSIVARASGCRAVFCVQEFDVFLIINKRGHVCVLSPPLDLKIILSDDVRMIVELFMAWLNWYWYNIQ